MGIPYAQLGIAALILILLGLNIYAFRKIGKLRGDQRAKAAEAALATERTVADAVERAREHPLTADDLGLRDQGGGQAPR